MRRERKLYAADFRSFWVGVAGWQGYEPKNKHTSNVRYTLQLPWLLPDFAEGLDGLIYFVARRYHGTNSQSL